MKRVERFGRFLSRFWPLWLPMLFVLALPVARPIVREQVLGSPLMPYDSISLGQIWGQLRWGGYQEVANPLPDVATAPNDLDLQVWQSSWLRSDSGETLTRPSAKGLVARFPSETVVYALAIRDLELDDELGAAATLPPGGNSSVGSTPAGIARLKSLAQKARQLEPDNAYWWVQAALAQELNGRPQAALPLLERAARCSFYDDKNRAIARRCLAAFASRRALTWEEKRAVVEIAELYDSGQSAQFWGNRARYLAKRGQARGALRWSGAMAGIGDVMGRSPASIIAFSVGRVWQGHAWSVAVPANATRQQRGASGASERFALYAARNGRPDLAKTTRAQAARARQNAVLLDASRSRTGDYWMGSEGLDAALQTAQIGGVMLIGAAAYLAAWWMAANIFGWRARGDASTRRARLALSGVVVWPLLALAALCGWWFWLDSSRASGAPAAPHREAYQVIYGTLGAFAFVSAPWLLALFIAAHMLWRERAQFALPPRVDLELRLARPARLLLRWALPGVVIGSALALIGGWGLAMLGLWFNWRSVDVLAGLPPDRNGKTGSWVWDIGNEPWIFVYGLLLCVICLVVWFAKWRWGTPHRLRPFTHSALRTWKESLGCAVAWVLWVYLLLILLSLPVRVRAEARLNEVLQRGEIAVMRDRVGSEAKGKRITTVIKECA